MRHATERLSSDASTMVQWQKTTLIQMGVITYWGPPLSIHQNSRAIKITTEKKKQHRQRLWKVICNLRDSRRECNRIAIVNAHDENFWRQKSNWLHTAQIKNKCSVFRYNALRTDKERQTVLAQFSFLPNSQLQRKQFQFIWSNCLLLAIEC